MILPLPSAVQEVYALLSDYLTGCWICWYLEKQPISPRLTADKLALVNLLLLSYHQFHCTEVLLLSFLLIFWKPFFSVKHLKQHFFLIFAYYYTSCSCHTIFSQQLNSDIKKSYFVYKTWYLVCYKLKIYQKYLKYYALYLVLLSSLIRQCIIYHQNSEYCVNKLMRLWGGKNVQELI